MSTNNQYDAPCGHCMTPKTYEKHTPGELPHDYHDVWQGGLDGTDQAAIEEAKRRRTQAPGVEEWEKTIDGWKMFPEKEYSGLIDYDRIDIHDIKSFIRTLLTTLQQEKEALVREILAAGKVHGGTRDHIWNEEILAIAARHGINIQ